jgi:hypothetical protein
MVITPIASQTGEKYHLPVIYFFSPGARRVPDHPKIGVVELDAHWRGRPVQTAERAEEWLRQYARVITHPVVAIDPLYGSELEAHQQNTMMRFSPDGKARSLLIRDLAMTGATHRC